MHPVCQIRFKIKLGGKNMLSAPIGLPASVSRTGMDSKQVDVNIAAVVPAGENAPERNYSALVSHSGTATESIHTLQVIATRYARVTYIRSLLSRITKSTVVTLSIRMPYIDFYAWYGDAATRFTGCVQKSQVQLHFDARFGILIVSASDILAKQG